MITSSKLQGIMTVARKQCPYTIKPHKTGENTAWPEAEVVENEPATSYSRRVKLNAKHQALEQLKSKWEEKHLHGQNPKRAKEKDVDQDKTHNWPSTPGLKSETECFIIAAQDQCIKTNYYRNKNLKYGTDPLMWRNLWAISRNSWPPCLRMLWTCQDRVHTKTQ